MADTAPPRASTGLSVVLPALNEEANITRAVEGWSRAAASLAERHEVIVVDDGSTDRTAAIVERASAEDGAVRLVRHERNRGYGAALRSGFGAAGFDLVFFTDADNQFDPADLARLVALADRADAVVGYRAVRRDPLPRRIGAAGWNLLMRLLFRAPGRDQNCACKLFRASALQGLELRCSGNAINTEILVKLGRSGARIVEIPVRHLPRTAGTATGFSWGMVRRAFADLVRMYPDLTGRASNAGAAVATPTRPRAPRGG